MTLFLTLFITGCAQALAPDGGGVIVVRPDTGTVTTSVDWTTSAQAETEPSLRQVDTGQVVVTPRDGEGDDSLVDPGRNQKGR
ncbi:MAG: hypothetical protein Q8P18_22510 [Pseudomonadota bacterium]|nr:hypothetical protein [Pseudomonadota bacterium]